MQGDGPEPPEFRVPTPPPEPRRRPSAVSGAAAVFAIAGTFSLASILLLAGSGRAPVIAFLAAFGSVLLVAAIGAFTLAPWGRPLGVVVAIVGMVFAIARIVDGTEQALIDLVAYGYALFALGTSGPAFRRG